MRTPHGSFNEAKYLPTHPSRRNPTTTILYVTASILVLYVAVEAMITTGETCA